MKTIIIAAMALAVAFPAAAQAQAATAQPPSGHAQHQVPHGEHDGRLHGQHGDGHHGDRHACCCAARQADRSEAGSEAHACCHDAAGQPSDR